MSPRFFSFSHPRLLRLSLASGAHSWPGFRRGQLAPNLVFVGGHPPLPPVRGTPSPCTPPRRVDRWFPKVYNLTSLWGCCGFDREPVVLDGKPRCPNLVKQGFVKKKCQLRYHSHGCLVKQPRPPWLPPEGLGKGVRDSGCDGLTPIGPSKNPSAGPKHPGRLGRFRAR